jgi:hypothetical protein
MAQRKQRNNENISGKHGAGIKQKGGLRGAAAINVIRSSRSDCSQPSALARPSLDSPLSAGGLFCGSALQLSPQLFVFMAAAAAHIQHICVAGPVGSDLALSSRGG